ncbi:MAG: hypothetical protein ACRDVE_14525 [Actinocrinis sp.]
MRGEEILRRAAIVHALTRRAAPPSPDLLAESAQRYALAYPPPDVQGYTPESVTGEWRDPYGPDPVVFGPGYPHQDFPGARMTSCPCGCGQPAGTGPCWNCGPVTAR